MAASLERVKQYADHPRVAVIHFGRAVQIVAISTIGGVVVALRYAKQLNALMIGEEEATYLGVNVNRLKWIILSINVVIIAVATAFTGVISFVGLVVPHILRMIGGADNRFLIVGSALSYEWSNGQLEGQVNRLKLIKRMMYGRGKLDLLRARVLHAIK
jgi:ABC-type cobalamin transport system permease subunit